MSGGGHLSAGIARVEAYPVKILHHTALEKNSLVSNGQYSLSSFAAKF